MDPPSSFDPSTTATALAGVSGANGESNAGTNNLTFPSFLSPLFQQLPPINLPPQFQQLGSDLQNNFVEQSKQVQEGFQRMRLALDKSITTNGGQSSQLAAAGPLSSPSSSTADTLGTLNVRPPVPPPPDLSAVAAKAAESATTSGSLPASSAHSSEAVRQKLQEFLVNKMRTNNGNANNSRPSATSQIRDQQQHTSSTGDISTGAVGSGNGGAGSNGRSPRTSSADHRARWSASAGAAAAWFQRPHHSFEYAPALAALGLTALAHDTVGLSGAASQPVGVSGSRDSGLGVTSSGCTLPTDLTGSPGTQGGPAAVVGGPAVAGANGGANVVQLPGQLGGLVGWQMLNLGLAYPSDDFPLRKTASAPNLQKGELPKNLKARSAIKEKATRQRSSPICPRRGGGGKHAVVKRMPSLDTNTSVSSNADSDPSSPRARKFLPPGSGSGNSVGAGSSTLAPSAAPKDLADTSTLKPQRPPSAGRFSPLDGKLATATFPNISMGRPKGAELPSSPEPPSCRYSGEPMDAQSSDNSLTNETAVPPTVAGIEPALSNLLYSQLLSSGVLGPSAQVAQDQLRMLGRTGGLTTQTASADSLAWQKQLIAAYQAQLAAMIEQQYGARQKPVSRTASAPLPDPLLMSALAGNVQLPVSAALSPLASPHAQVSSSQCSPTSGPLMAGGTPAAAAVAGDSSAGPSESPTSVGGDATVGGLSPSSVRTGAASHSEVMQQLRQSVLRRAAGGSTTTGAGTSVGASGSGGKKPLTQSPSLPPAMDRFNPTTTAPAAALAAPYDPNLNSMLALAAVAAANQPTTSAGAGVVGAIGQAPTSASVSPVGALAISNLMMSRSAGPDRLQTLRNAFRDSRMERHSQPESSSSFALVQNQRELHRLQNEVAAQNRSGAPKTGAIEDLHRERRKQLARTHSSPIVGPSPAPGSVTTSDGTVDLGSIAAGVLPSVTASNTPQINVLSARRTGLGYDELMLKHECTCNSLIVHLENSWRLISCMQRLRDTGLFQMCEVVKGRKATVEELKSCHTESYVNVYSTSAIMKSQFDQNLQNQLATRFRQLPCGGYGTDWDTVWNDISTPVAARIATGCVIDLASRVVKGHHAEADSAMGFCYFNSIAIAAKQLRAAFNLERILIVDWDVHHGNSTQQLFYNDPSVLYISLHRHDDGQFFPGTGSAEEYGTDAGRGFNVNIAWRGNCDPPMGDAEYLGAFRVIVLPIATEFKPQLILVSSGFDAACGHPTTLGGYSVSPACFAMMTQLLMEVQESGRIVLVLEGGYHADQLADCTEACVRALVDDQYAPKIEQAELNRPPCETALESLAQTLRIQSDFWSVLKRYGAQLHLSWNEARQRQDDPDGYVRSMASLSVKSGTLKPEHSFSSTESEPMEQN